MNSDELFEKMRAEARERHARSIRQQQEAFARREANEKAQRAVQDKLHEQLGDAAWRLYGPCAAQKEST